MEPINLKSFKKKATLKKRGFRSFLTRLEKKSSRKLDALAASVDKEVWQETDCLSCANCCKTMSPTYNTKDIKRIASHFGMTTKAFKEKWLYFDKKDKDWMNKKQPCQFLDLNTNMCNIYPIRPDDCAGFPHLTKKRMIDYMHVHKQNVEYCPATYKMVEKMKILVTTNKHLL
ncbi:MAG: YkgJ family cysteine cluster protein [Agriterribacter sp.]